MGDAVEAGTPCASPGWDEVASSVTSLLDSHASLSQEQYDDLLRQLTSIRATMGHLYAKMDAIEKETGRLPRRKASSSNIVSIR